MSQNDFGSMPLQEKNMGEINNRKHSMKTSQAGIMLGQPTSK